MRALGLRRRQRGSALVEMAIIVPVLILLFTGMVELARYAMMLNRVDAVTNSLAGVLYNLTSQEVADISVVDRVIDQATAIAHPDPAPTVTVRFCNWQTTSGSPELERVNIQYRPNNGGSACERPGPKCSSAATNSGHGTFVQVYACTTYNPVIVDGIFSIFHTSLPIESLSYIPMTSSNLVQQLGDRPGGGSVPESADCSTNPSLCGGGSGGGSGGGGGQKQCHPTRSCDSAKENFDVDQCACVAACSKPTEEKYNGRCSTSCLTGYARDNTTGQCACPPGMSPDGNLGCACPGANEEIVGTACTRKCTVDEERVDGECLAKCGTDEERVNKTCTAKCPDDYERINSFCTPKCTACQYREPEGVACLPKPNCTP